MLIDEFQDGTWCSTNLWLRLRIIRTYSWWGTRISHLSMARGDYRVLRFEQDYGVLRCAPANASTRMCWMRLENYRRMITALYQKPVHTQGTVKNCLARSYRRPGEADYVVETSTECLGNQREELCSHVPHNVIPRAGRGFPDRRDPLPAGWRATVLRPPEVTRSPLWLVFNRM